MAECNQLTPLPFNPFTADPVKALHFAILVQPTIFNFWHSGALALRTERQSARMSEIKNGGLHQYGAEPFERQQFGTSGVEKVKVLREDANDWELRSCWWRRHRWRRVESLADCTFHGRTWPSRPANLAASPHPPATTLIAIFSSLFARKLVAMRNKHKT